MKKTKYFVIISAVFVIVAMVAIGALIGNSIPIISPNARALYMWLMLEFTLLGSVVNYAVYVTTVWYDRKNRQGVSDNRKTGTLIFKMIYTVLHLLFWGINIYSQVIVVLWS